MNKLVGIALVLLLSGCAGPSFDERMAEAHKSDEISKNIMRTKASTAIENSFKKRVPLYAGPSTKMHPLKNGEKIEFIKSEYQKSKIFSESPMASYGAKYEFKLTFKQGSLEHSVRVLYTYPKLPYEVPLDGPKFEEFVNSKGYPQYDDHDYFWSGDVLKKYRKSKKVLEAIQNRTVFIGMPEDAMILAYGSDYKINSTTTKYGTSKQYVFKNSYIYTEHGKVTAFQ